MSIIRKEAYFASTTGEHKVRCMIWEDDSVNKKGIFQIAHGVCDYSERYDSFARFLASNGFVVCANDHLGHGKTAGSLEKLSEMPDDASIRIVDDMHKLHNIMQKRYPELPYYLFGHSMGSFCARIYSSVFGDELAGVVYCGTASIPYVSSLLIPLLEKAVNVIGPQKKYQFLYSLSGKAANIGIKNPKTPSDWLSANEENVQKFIEDPYCFDLYSLSFCRDTFKLAVECNRKNWQYKVPLGLPILMISGEKDCVGMFTVGVKATYEQLLEAGHLPKLILYPDRRHEILNDNNKEEVYNDVLNWLNDIDSNVIKSNSTYKTV